MNNQIKIESVDGVDVYLDTKTKKFKAKIGTTELSGWSFGDVKGDIVRAKRLAFKSSLVAGTPVSFRAATRKGKGGYWDHESERWHDGEIVRIEKSTVGYSSEPTFSIVVKAPGIKERSISEKSVYLRRAPLAARLNALQSQRDKAARDYDNLREAMNRFSVYSLSGIVDTLTPNEKRWVSRHRMIRPIEVSDVG